MAIKHSLEQAWSTFRMEQEIREDLLSILSLTAGDLNRLCLSADLLNLDRPYSFDSAFEFWKNQLIKQATVPGSPSTAIDSFALFWDDCILQILRVGGQLQHTHLVQYLQKRFAPLLRNYQMVRLVRSEQKREDAFNEALYKCLHKWGNTDFEPNQGLVSYFKKAFENTCRDIVRIEIKDIHLAPLETLSPAAQQVVDAKLEAINMSLLQTAFKEFGIKNKPCHDLLIMKEEGYSTLEISEKLMISEVATRKRLARCRENVIAFYQKIKSRWSHEE